MANFTLLHTGDEHLDNSTYGVRNPSTGLNTAWESNVSVVKHMVNFAVEQNVSCYLSAGDAFNDGRPSIEALMLYVDAHRPLIAAGIPIVLLHGNHHEKGVNKGHRTVIYPVAEMLRAAGGVVYAVDQPQLIRLPNGLQIAALPWLDKHNVLHQLGLTDLTPAEGDARVAKHGLDLLTRMAEAADASSPLVMTSHTTVDTLVLNAAARGSEVELTHFFSEPVLSLAGLEELPFDYGGVSHIHRPQALSERFHYAGSPNNLTLTDMGDEKGANFVTIGEDRALNVQRVLTPARAMNRIDLEAGEIKAQFEAIQDGALVEVVLETGQTAIPQTVRAAVNNANATIVKTTPRPTPIVKPERVEIPKQLDATTALRLWAEHNPTTGITVDALVAAAENLKA